MSETATTDPSPLSLVETRILGCLIEKEATTPDLYPLTLNSLVNACNQKSNRLPQLQLDDQTVSTGLESLRLKKLVLLVTQSEARVAKYRHSLDNVYPIPKPQVAILAELLLRGPQTAGELRTRCERMCHFESLDEMKSELAELAQRSSPLVIELPRQPGKKDSRFAHLLSGEPEFEASELTSATPDQALKVDLAMTLSPEVEERISNLEQTVSDQADAIKALQAELAEFRAQFE
ncbi:YceH family protein [Pelagicoccus albus]|uniref:YceH family protein n=1 Tax=Pelagicoccus albus TaxID=415222 RepID=A0A7X1B2Q0_9BACT|nr:YceH family protein [Pelagicoccus albus]MBC2604467.1 YceH family protein [Pelagicoccus albus]